MSAIYNSFTDRRVFDVEDAAGGNVRGGRADAGVIFDGDRFNNEGGDDFDQTGVVTSRDGLTTFATGNIYLEQSYTLTAPLGGTIQLYRIEVDGLFVGYVSSAPLEPGVTYAATTANVTPFNAPDATDPTAIINVPCFCVGTLIRTPIGDAPIETLRAGDRVTGASGEERTIRWIGERRVLASLADERDLWPVLIKKGALGAGLPIADLMVSPNHRMLITSAVNELHFGEASVLVAAKFLVDQDGIERQTNLHEVLYFHMLFDDHEVVVSNGVPSESLYPGDITLQGMADSSREEILAIFPELDAPNAVADLPIAALPLRRYEAKLLETRQYAGSLTVDR